MYVHCIYSVHVYSSIHWTVDRSLFTRYLKNTAMFTWSPCRLEYRGPSNLPEPGALLLFEQNLGSGSSSGFSGNQCSAGFHHGSEYRFEENMTVINSVYLKKFWNGLTTLLRYMVEPCTLHNRSVMVLTLYYGSCVGRLQKITMKTREWGGKQGGPFNGIILTILFCWKTKVVCYSKFKAVFFFMYLAKTNCGVGPLILWIHWEFVQRSGVLGAPRREPALPLHPLQAVLWIQTNLHRIRIRFSKFRIRILLESDQISKNLRYFCCCNFYSKGDARFYSKIISYKNKILPSYTF